MSEEILFTEKQAKKPIWVWLIIGVVSVSFVFAFISQIFFNKPIGEQTSADGMLILNFVLLGLFIYLLASLSLLIKITKERIYYRFKPFHLKWRSIEKEEIDKIYVREYKPVLEYGGWGLKSKMNGKGMSFTMRGRMGLQINLNNGKDILLGTQKAKDMEEAIKRFK